jgi:hypothetical protein
MCCVVARPTEGGHILQFIRPPGLDGCDVVDDKIVRGSAPDTLSIITVKDCLPLP